MSDIRLCDLLSFVSLFFQCDQKICIWCEFDKRNHYFLLSDLDRKDKNRIARDFMQQYGKYKVVSFSWYVKYNFELHISI